MATHSSILNLENSMDRGAWWATVHGVAELDMTENINTHTCTHNTLTHSLSPFSPQWLTLIPVQGAWVPSLVRELDSMFHS